MTQQQKAGQNRKEHPRPARSDPAQPTGRRGGPIALLVIAGLLTAAGLVQLRVVWVNLPLPKSERLDVNAVVQAFRSARASWTGDVRSGVLLAIISSHFTTALHEPDRLSELYEDARAGYAGISGTQLGRLQLAALAMFRFERENAPLASWWTALEPYLTGLDNASFGHFLPELLAANTAVYTQLGLAAGSARRSARNVVGYPHGPFLEYFAERMERMARARDEAGDPAAATACRRLVRRLLQQWVLDPAPPAVRLLAADLLIGSLTADRPASAPAATTDVVRGLRQWRAAYRDHAARRPTPLSLLSSSYAPVADQSAHDRLRDAIAVLLWITPALVVAVIMAALAATPWLRHSAAGAGLRAALAGGLLLGLALIAAGFLYFQVNPAGAHDDLRRLGSPDLGWPRYPFVSAAVAVVLLVLVAVWPARGGQRAARVAAWATALCVLLAAVLMGTCLWARAATAHYETRTAALLDSGEFAALAGAEADRQLDPLRAWNP